MAFTDSSLQLEIGISRTVITSSASPFFGTGISTSDNSSIEMKQNRSPPEVHQQVVRSHRSMDSIILVDRFGGWVVTYTDDRGGASGAGVNKYSLVAC